MIIIITLKVRDANKWLMYGEPLHRLREFGAAIKEMDLIDEAPLSSEQMAVIVCHLTGSGNMRDLPHPDEVRMSLYEFDQTDNGYISILVV